VSRSRLIGSWWILLTLVPFGFTAWAAPVYAGARARVRGWIVAGIAYGVLCAVGFALAGSQDEDTAASDVGVILLLAGWVIPLGHSLAIRHRYFELVEHPEIERGTVRERREAEANARMREEGRRLAREDPVRALELRVGRPDLPDSFDAGLVDLNNAPVDVLDRVPGVDKRLARRIAETRAEINGFESLDDAGVVLGLDAATLDRMRLHVVVLPRGTEV
jgi:hypothetical protein